jgi:hypothetical protein
MAVMTLARKWLRTRVPSAFLASFSDWLSATVRSEFVLCEIEPSKTLSGWTAVGGAFGDTYFAPFPRFHQTSVFQGGLYGKVIGVVQNNVPLTERTSVALVTANPGSYFWDAAGELLYVKTTTQADPDTFALIQVNVRFYLANAPITLRLVDSDPDSAVYYHPWLTNDLPRIRRIREDLLSGVMATPEGHVSFTNGHGAWFTFVAPDGLWNWKYKPLRFYIGGGYRGLMLKRSQFQAMAAMRIEDVAPNEEVCTFQLSPLQRVADQQLPVTPFFEDVYPNLGDGVRGTKKWIGYGRAIIPPDLTDTSGFGVYTVADAAYQTLFAVHNVWAIHKTTGAWTLLTETTHYTKNLTTCTITIVSAAFPHADYTLAVDVTGKPDGAGSYFKTYATIVRNILETFLGASADALDAAAFTQAGADSTTELSFWIKSDRLITSILATAEPDQPSLGRSTMGTLQQTVDGKWTTSIWNPDTDMITTTLRQADFASFTPKPKLKTVYATVRVFYGFDHVRQQWSVVEADDPTTRYRTKSTDRLDLYTYLTSETDALRLAQRYQLLAGAITVEAGFKERGALLCRMEGGGKTFVTYRPAPSLAGEYVNQPFECKDLEIVMAPKLEVSGVLSNLHGLGGRVGRWMPDTAANWSAATAAERQTSGFWCDDSGRADPADPESANQSIWW